MPAISNEAKNNVSLSNRGLGTDLTVDEATMTVDEAQRSVDFVGEPVTKLSKNDKSLTNESENT